jgi:ferric-dicitrate binding protein FerR (iron transport regulator)
MPEFRYGWYAAAASIAALVVLTTTLWLGQISDTAGKEIHYITCLTQQAERLQVILPDSSIVWLNANSELSYPEEFTEGREVTLTGEAFFDVRKSTEHQFTVKTKQMQVQVMGTQFMVSDYPDAKTVETVLLSGRVNVRPVDNAGEGVALTPNLQWQLSLDNMQACVNSVDAALYTGWITGKMAFENATLKEVSERLGRWYGIKISVSNDMDAVYRLTFTIRDETWKETQTVIRNIAPELTFAESGDNTEIIHMDKSLTR